MKRYIRLFMKIISFQAMSEMEFNTNFVANVLLHLTWLLIPIFFYGIVYSKTQFISGWNYQEVLLLIGAFQIFEGINQLTYFGGVFQFLTAAIRTGDLDYVLLRPINSQFLVSAKAPDIFGLTDLAVGLFVVIKAAFALKITLTLMNVSLFFLLLANGVIISYSIFYFLALTVFFTTRESSLLYIVDEAIDETITKPGSIFGKNFMMVLTYIIPLLLMTALPVKAIIQKVTLFDCIYSLLVGIGLLLLSNVAWKRVLRRYSSASS